MKLINSTDFPDAFLRRMVSWCCKQLDLPVRYVKTAQFRNRRSSYSGHAWPAQRRICVSVGTTRWEYTDQSEKPDHSNYCEVREPEKPVIYRVRRAVKKTLDERTDTLLRVTAHECAHLMLSRFGYSLPSGTQKPMGRRLLKHGGSEQQTTWHENELVKLFLADREQLISSWNVAEPVAEKTKGNAQEKRYEKAQAMLATWQRKAKIAAGKIKKYKCRVAYYERQFSAAAATKEKSPS